jgi:hypothetical protein
LIISFLPSPGFVVYNMSVLFTRLNYTHDTQDYKIRCVSFGGSQDRMLTRKQKAFRLRTLEEIKSK